MLVLSIDIGETLVLAGDDGRTRITLTGRTGRRANLRIDAPDAVRISREPAARPETPPPRGPLSRRLARASEEAARRK